MNRNSILVGMFGLLTSAMFQGSHAYARDGVESDPGTIDEIIVTATRRQESLQDIPVSVTAFSGDQIKKLGLTSSWDLASQIPGLNIIGPFNLSSPQISVRGVGNNGFNANNVSTVGVYSDEVYLNQSLAHGFQMFDLERVELLRGPQGTLYGVNTTSGALNFISKKPSQEREFSGEVSYGAFDQIKAEGAANLPLGENLAFRGAIAFNKHDGFRKNNFLDIDAEFVESFAWRGQLLFNPSENMDILLKVHGARARNDGAVYEQQGVIDPDTFGLCATKDIAAGKCMDFFGNFESPDFYSSSSDVAGFENIDVFGASATINWDFNSVRLTSISAFDDTNRETQDELDGSPFDEAQDQLVSNADAFSQEIRLTSTGSERFNWIAGAYYFQESSNEFFPLPVRAFGPGGLTGASSVLEGVYRYYELDTTNWALFADAGYDITSKLAVRGGLRYTYEKKEISYEAAIFDADGTDSSTVFTLDEVRSRSFYTTIDRAEENSWKEFTGRIALEYAANDNLLFYGSYARGFRGGNFNSGALFSDSEFTLVNPEFLDAFEVGAKSTLMGGRATLNASGFYYKYKDQQVTTVINGQQLLGNAASAPIWGGEVEFTARPTDALFAYFGLSLLKAEYDAFIGPTGDDLSGNKLENAPGVTFNGMLTYTTAIGANFQAVLQTDFAYKGSHFLDFSNNPLSEQEGFWLHNASLSLSPNNERFKVSVWVKNLWDQQYNRNWADLSGFGFNLISTGAPRTFGVSVTVSFQ